MSKIIVALDARLALGSSTGDSTYWSGLLHGLNAIQADARFLLFSRGAKPPELVLDDRFEWIALPAKSSRWWSLVQFPLKARKMGARAIHTQYSLSPMAGKRGITTVHDVSFFIGPEWFKPKDRLVLSQTVPAAVRRAAKVLTVSEHGLKEIERYIPAAKGKTIVTPNACPPWIQAVDRETAKQRVATELEIKEPYLLTVGTRWPRKNMRLAVEAANGIDKRFPHRLVITGKYGWGDDGLGERGRAAGYVETDLLSCLYSAADLYLAPSLHEGFGIPLLEAFRCGCPVICSTGGALPEVADGAAIVEKSWEAADWTRTIESTLDDPSKLNSLRKSGFEREKHYSWTGTAQKTFDVYREVAK